MNRKNKYTNENKSAKKKKKDKINLQLDNLHFNWTLRGALLVDVVPKQTTLQYVPGGHRDQKKSNDESQEAQNWVDEDRSLQIFFNFVVIEYQVEVCSEKQDSNVQNLE